MSSLTDKKAVALAFRSVVFLYSSAPPAESGVKGRWPWSMAIGMHGTMERGTVHRTVAWSWIPQNSDFIVCDNLLSRSESFCNTRNERGSYRIERLIEAETLRQARRVPGTEGARAWRLAGGVPPNLAATTCD